MNKKTKTNKMDQEVIWITRGLVATILILGSYVLSASLGELGKSLLLDILTRIFLVISMIWLTFEWIKIERIMRKLKRS